MKYQKLGWKVTNDIKKKFNMTGTDEDDLFQDAILVMCEKIKNYDSKRGNFESFMYPQMWRELTRKYLGQDMQRMVNDETQTEIIELAYNDDYDSIDEDLSVYERMLSDRERQYFTAFYTERMEKHEIARNFSVGKSAVTKMMKKIHKKIKEKIHK